MNFLNYNSGKIKMRSRRGISQIIGSLMMVAIVSTVGSVVVFQALNGIQGFNNLLTGSFSDKRSSASESILIEHVQYQTSSPCSPSPCVTIWFRNVGTSDSKIQTIKILDISTQVLVLNKENVDLQLNVRSMVSKQYTHTDLLEWSPTGKTYKISVTTSIGNSYSTTTTTYNT